MTRDLDMPHSGHTSRPLLCCALACAVLAGDKPATGQDDVAALSGATMGTTYHIKVVGEFDATALQTDVDALLESVNDQMSTYREDSEITRFNRHATSDWFEVSPEFVLVVQRALEVAEDSQGAFDPTVGPLVGLWNFGADAAGGAVPSQEAIDAARRHVGYELIEVRTDPPALRKIDPQVRLDLSAIAKGHGVDRVADHLHAAGIAAWMIEIGGEVRTRGAKPDGSPWRIGIEQPVAGRRLLDSALALNDSALATSGDYRNFHELDGVRYSHTIDPSTGRPVTHRLASVSVLADDCMTADAWATTLMVLGPEAGLDWAGQRGIRAYFIVRAGNELTAFHTDGFPALESPPATDHATDSVSDVAPASADHWTTFLLALAIFGVATIGLAIGVILSNRRLRGTCGGLAGLRDEQGRAVCDACTNPADDCDEFRRRITTSAAAASRREPEQS